MANNYSDSQRLHLSRFSASIDKSTKLTLPLPSKSPSNSDEQAPNADYIQKTGGTVRLIIKRHGTVKHILFIISPLQSQGKHFQFYCFYHHSAKNFFTTTTLLFGIAAPEVYRRSTTTLIPSAQLCNCRMSSGLSCPTPIQRANISRDTKLPASASFQQLDSNRQSPPCYLD